MKLQNGPLALLVIFLVTAPSAASRMYYHITKDPTFQPLGITKERLSAFDRGPVDDGILTEIRWGSGGSGSRPALERALAGSFAAYGVESRFRHVTDPGQVGVTIRFRVGPTDLGPYSVGQAPHGVQAAVAAFGIYDGRERKSRVARFFGR
jgi:hypothetical protein